MDRGKSKVGVLQEADEEQPSQDRRDSLEV